MLYIHARASVREENRVNLAFRKFAALYSFTSIIKIPGHGYACVCVCAPGAIENRRRKQTRRRICAAIKARAGSISVGRGCEMEINNETRQPAAAGARCGAAAAMWSSPTCTVYIGCAGILDIVAGGGEIREHFGIPRAGFRGLTLMPRMFGCCRELIRLYLM